MKKIGFILILFMLIALPCVAKDKIEENKKSPVVFVYHIPDEKTDTKSEEQKIEEPQDIISDDITADTSLENKISENENDQNLNDENNDKYEISDLYSDVLKGYAVYNEDEEIALDFETLKPLELDIKQPSYIGCANYTQLKTTPLKFYDNNYSKFYIPEFRIVPVSSSNDTKLGIMRIGASYNQYIDYGELEQTSGIYSRYQYKNFAIKTSYTKTVNSTNNNYNDQFFFAPEFKINQYFTLINTYSADITKRNKKAELMLSINPLGNKDPDFMRFDIGASQTYNELNNTFKSQFRFATRFNF